MLSHSIQTFSKEAKTFSTLNAAIQGYEKGSFITYRVVIFYCHWLLLIGLATKWIYIEDATLLFTIPFGSTANIIDCIYFPLNVLLTEKRVLKKVAAKTMLVDRTRLAGSPKDTDASINESIDLQMILYMQIELHMNFLKLNNLFVVKGPLADTVADI
uniref:Uncharacterized protein n=1 Tax=Panagrolaimus sp. ES5 TaxID=591445 RepID=A0AC34GWL1_9BILA